MEKSNKKINLINTILTNYAIIVCRCRIYINKVEIN
jgi:hypothetical protein